MKSSSSQYRREGVVVEPMRSYDNCLWTKVLNLTGGRLGYFTWIRQQGWGGVGVTKRVYQGPLVLARATGKT